VSQTERAYTLIGCRVSLRPLTFTYDQTAIRSPGLPFNGLNARNPRNYIGYYSFIDPNGWKAELAWLVYP